MLHHILSIVKKHSKNLSLISSKMLVIVQPGLLNVFNDPVATTPEIFCLYINARIDPTHARAPVR